MLGGVVKTFSYPWFRHYLPARDLCHHPGIFFHHWSPVPSGKVQPLPWHVSACEQLAVWASWEHRGKWGSCGTRAQLSVMLQACLVRCAAWCIGEGCVSDFFLGRKWRFLLGEQGPAENTTHRHLLRAEPWGVFPLCWMCTCWFGFFFPPNFC